jgi:major membrane immunogen (membrane-anchored lipoprotein)
MRVEDIEQGILGLPQDQLKRFRAWYEKFDADTWDDQIEQDAKDGKLDAIAESALAEYKSGKARKL